MRRVLFIGGCLLAVAVVAPATQRGGGTDEPVTIRGCLRQEGVDWVLYPNESAYQAPERVGLADDLERRSRFALAVDRDLLPELSNHERHEIDVTGHLTFPEPQSVAIIEAPRGFGRPEAGRADPFGRGGPPPGPFTDPGSSVGRGRTTPDGTELLLVTEFDHVSLNCRQ